MRAGDDAPDTNSSAVVRPEWPAFDPMRADAAELVERFGGVTAYLRAPASGAWIAPEGAVERDDVVMVEVVAPDLDRAWWREYVAVLKARFDQDEIHARALPAEKL